MCARLQSGSPCNVKFESSNWLANARKWLGKLGPGSFPSCLAPGDPRHAETPGSGILCIWARRDPASQEQIPASDTNEYSSNFTTCRRSLARCNLLDPATGSVLNPQPTKPGLPAELGHHRSAGATTASFRGYSEGQRPEDSCEAPSNSQVRRIISAAFLAAASSEIQPASLAALESTAESDWQPAVSPPPCLR